MTTVKVNVTPFLGTVLAGNGQELRKFRGLNSTETDAVMTETYQRDFLRNFFGSSCNWERMSHAKGELVKNSNKAKEKNAETTTAEGANFDNEVLANVVFLATKAKATEVKKELVSVNRMVTTDGKTSMVPRMEMAEKKVKIPKATAKVSFRFDSKKSMLVLEVIEVTAMEPSTEKHYRKDLEKALMSGRDAVECFYTLNDFIKSFFDTLHVHKMCYITGSEAVNMHKIYKHAKQAYPLFDKMGHRKQVDILDKGYRNSRSVSAGSRDIHAFAKGTFEAMCDEGGIIDQVYKHDFITNQLMLYKKIGEHRRDRVNPDNHNQIWEKNCLVFVDYVYGKSNIRTSLLAFDLWDLLARGVRSSERSVNSTVW